MPKTTEPKLDCKCIDIESLANFRIALLTSRDTYDDIASRLIGMNVYKSSSEVENIREQARKFDILLHALDNIPPC